MNPIINQYRIIRSIGEDAIASNYAVTELLENKNVKTLSIIDDELVSNALVDFFVDKHVMFRNLTSPFIMKSYDFGIIKKTENKLNALPQYYIVTEYIEQQITLDSVIDKIDNAQALELFVQACKAIYYLHSKDIFYKEINFETILLKKDKDKYLLILKDLAAAELYRRNYRSDEKRNSYFKSPEEINESELSSKVDIYSLGVLLFCLVIHKKRYHNNFKSDFAQFSNSCTDKFGCQMIPIIAKMTTNAVNRYANVEEVINDINTVFFTNFDLLELNKNSHLNYNTKLVGRFKELEIIRESIDKLLVKKADKRFISVHGEYGIGKTEFIKTLKNKLYLKNINVYWSIDCERNSNVASILKQLLDNSEYVNKYDVDFIKYITSVANGNHIETAEYDKKITILRFIYECIKDTSTIFILDDISKADSYIIDIFEKLVSINKNLLFIFSYRNGFGNEYLFDFLNRIKNSGSVIDIELQPFNVEETSLFLKYLLGLSYLPKKLAKSICSHVNGNPLFTLEVLKNLIATNLIYIDKQSGMWVTDICSVDYDKISFPVSIEDAAPEHIKDIDDNGKKILTALSIFNIDVSYKELNALVDIGLKQVFASLEVLIRKEIINKVTGNPDQYNISNRIVRNYLYKKIPNEEKKSKHKIATEVLSNIQPPADEIINEIIYHLEKSEQHYKLLHYSLENAERHMTQNNYDRAIENLKRALHICKQNGYTDKEFDILLKLSWLYKEGVNLPKSTEYLKQCESYDYILTDTEKRLTVINKLAHNCSAIGDYDKAKAYLQKAAEIFNEQGIKEKYHTLYVEYLSINCFVLCDMSDYSGLYIKAKEAIAECSENDYLYKGRLFHALGVCCKETFRRDEAIRSFWQAKDCFEKISNDKAVLRSLTSIANTYISNFNYSEMAKKIYKDVIEKAIKKQIPSSQATALINLASTYQIDLEFEKAEVCATEALQIFELLGEEPFVEFSRFNLGILKCYTCKYDEAYQYYISSKKILKSETVYIYSQLGAVLFLAFGDFEHMQEHIDKMLEIQQDSLTTHQRLTHIHNEFIKIFNYAKNSSNLNCKEQYLTNSIVKIKTLNLKMASKSEAFGIMCDLVLILRQTGYHFAIRDVYDEMIRISSDWSNFSSYIKARAFFIKSFFDEDESKLSTLKKACKKAEESCQPLLLAHVFIELGDYYINKDNLFQASNNYAEACGIVRDLVKIVPSKYIASFINRHNLLQPFIKIASLRNNNAEISFGGDILQTIFSNKIFEDMCSDKYLMDSAREIYFSDLPSNIRSRNDVIKNLSINPEKNLQLLAKYIVAVTYASKCFVIIQTPDGSFVPIASNDGSSDMKIDLYILKRAKSLRDSVFETEKYNSANTKNDDLLKDRTKAVICMPIMFDDNINGYIYVYSNSIFNNFNAESLDECKRMLKLIGIYIEQHLLIVNSSLDKLTGALNRKYLEDEIDQKIEKANENHSVFSIILMDMDKFKTINDTFGHQAGDRALQLTSNTIKANLRRGTSLGRYGGEEFIIILEGENSKSALLIAERLRLAIEKSKVLGLKQPVTASMGIATYPTHDVTKNGLIEKADQALRVCKNNGRNRCEIWNKTYSKIRKGVKTFSGIITGDIIKDSMRMRMSLKIIELVTSDIPASKKLAIFIEKILELTEAESATVFINETNGLKKAYSYPTNTNNNETTYCNEIINNAVSKKECVLISAESDNILAKSCGIPDNISIIASPLLRDEASLGVIYLTASKAKKIFKHEDYTYLNYLSNLAAAIVAKIKD